ncbi:MAG: hypothetical protein ACLTCI_07490 [[Clostridium] nexile]
MEISKINALFHEDEPALSLPEAFYLATKGAGTFLERSEVLNPDMNLMLS